MKFLIGLLVLLPALNSFASNFNKIYSCNGGELVVDVDLENPSEIQLVVNGKHAVDTLLFGNPDLGGKVYNEGRTLVIGKLAAYRRSGEFVHIHEGAGYYPAERVVDPRSIMDVEEVNIPGKKGVGNIGPFGHVRLDIFGSKGASSGLFGSTPKRTAFSEQGSVLLIFGQNNYFFYNCRE